MEVTAAASGRGAAREKPADWGSSGQARAWHVTCTASATMLRTTPRSTMPRSPLVPRFLLAAMLGAGLLAPSSARAEDTPVAAPEAAPPAPPDTLYLRNGGMIRGRVQEILPTSHVLVTLSTGEVRRVPWNEIERVIVASAATIPPLPSLPSTPPPAVAPPAPTTPLPMVGPRVRVHVESKKKVELHRKRDGVGGTSGWVHACMSPCDVELPLGDTYKVTGSGILSSSEFHLHAEPNHTANVVVDPTSIGGMVIGGLLGGAGGWGAYVGLLMVAIGASQADADCSSRLYSGYYGSTSTASYNQCQSQRRTGPGLRDAGLVVLGASVAAGVAGVLVLITSAPTDISQPGGSSSKDAFLREPTWKRPSAVESAARAPASMFVPLLDARF